MRRTFPVLSAVLGALLLLSACGGSSASPTAAKVNSTRILRSELNDQLEVLSKNTRWMKQVAEQFGKKTLSEPNGGVSTALTAAWLTAMLNQVVVDEEFEAKNLEVTDQDRQDARAAAEQLFNTEQGQTFDSMPKWFRDDFLAGQERYEAVKDVVPDNPPATDAQVENLFSRVQQQYCPGGNAVSHILKSTLEEAQQVAAALAAGEDFVTLARESEDTGTDTAGGFLTCTGSPNYQQLPESFREAIAATPVGGVTPPLQSEAGWHVIRVTPFDLANVRAFVADLYRRSLEPPMTQFINNQLLKAKLWVDPRYGTLHRGPVRVQPPEPPQVRNKPTTSTAGTPPGS